MPLDAGRWESVDALRSEMVEVDAPRDARWHEALEFAVYVNVALVVHALLAVPAVIARFVGDTLFGGGVFAAIRPKRRGDLF